MILIIPSFLGTLLSSFVKNASELQEQAPKQTMKESLLGGETNEMGRGRAGG